MMRAMTSEMKQELSEGSKSRRFTWTSTEKIGGWWDWGVTS
jgi:hypothetical protein